MAVSIIKTLKGPIVLAILDGWGIAPVWGGNAISMARTKAYDTLFLNYPSTTLQASGQSVGLPNGAPGNSEAGHLNIGAGYVVHQDGLIIDEEIKSGAFFTNETLKRSIEHVTKYKSSLHLVGLLSKTGTHSQIKHIYATLKYIKEHNFKNVFLHLFSDGRDSSPTSGIEMIVELEEKMKEIGIGQIASIIGRFYAMDRDNRWERIREAYELLVDGKGFEYPTADSVFSSSYSKGVTDEFIRASSITSKDKRKITINDNDAVIFFNFRSDRARELSSAFMEPNFLGFPGRKLLKNLFFCSFVMHDENQLSIPVFALQRVDDPLAQIWSDCNLKQFHIAETEKYAHITYFLNGGVETLFPGEDRLMIPSPERYKTYDSIPQMSIEKVTGAVVERIRGNKYGCYAINLANPDMVGHTGNLKATIKAVEYVDEALGILAKEIIAKNGVMIVCADHGNAEQMVNPKTGDPDTEHTENPVPFILVSEDKTLKNLKLREDGALSSIVPTILDIMGISGIKNKEKTLIKADGK